MRDVHHVRSYGPIQSQIVKPWDITQTQLCQLQEFISLRIYYSWCLSSAEEGTYNAGQWLQNWVSQ